MITLKAAKAFVRSSETRHTDEEITNFIKAGQEAGVIETQKELSSFEKILRCVSNYYGVRSDSEKQQEETKQWVIEAYEELKEKEARVIDEDKEKLAKEINKENGIGD